MNFSEASLTQKKDTPKKESAQERKQKKVENFLREVGALDEIDGVLIVDKSCLEDKEKFQDAFREKRRHTYGFSMTWIFDYLATHNAIEKADYSENLTDEQKKQLEKRILKVPNNSDELLVGVSEGHINPWDIGTKKYLEGTINLSDGVVTTVREQYVAEALSKLNARRQRDDVLYITDPRDGKRKEFSFNILREVTDLNSDFSKYSSKEILYERLPNLAKEELIREQDMKRMSSSKEGEKYGAHERKFNNSTSAHYFNFTHEGESARYYFGKNKLVGTEIPIDPENMSVLHIDDSHAAVTKKIYGKKQIIQMIQLLDGDRAGKLRQRALKKIKNKSFSQNRSAESVASSYAVVAADTMNNLVSSYDLFEYLPRYIKDNPAEHADKMAYLADVDFVADEFRKTISRAGVGMIKLPWKEQLLVAAALLRFENEDQVIDFLKKYKMAGLRTFLSLEQGGPEMGDKILTIGKKLPQESAETLFEKYGEMITATESVEKLLKDNLKERATPEIIENARESLLTKGKELLEKYADKASVCEEMECERIGQELDQELSLARASIYAFAAASRTLVQNGEFNFEDFQSAELSFEKSPLAPSYKEQIIAMHKENTKQYPEKLRDYWRETLNNGLDNENPNQLVVSVKHEEGVVSAMRVIAQEDGSWYGASFNVNPTIQGSRIGTELLKEVIEKLAIDKPFVADCYAENPMLDVYQNKFDFKITDTYEDYKDTGAKVYQITKYPEKNGAQG